jgi:hypothetical protein
MSVYNREGKFCLVRGGILLHLLQMQVDHGYNCNAIQFNTSHTPLNMLVTTAANNPYHPPDSHVKRALLTCDCKAVLVPTIPSHEL